ncbi:MAG: hypothetical protein AAGE94_24665 [Acidobacteriota bacterium]
MRVAEGVWGKVDGAASDYRWIASSSGLPIRDSDLLGALAVGAEDRPARCFFWRVLDAERAVAIAAYPSRAIDAAGRGGAVERRVLLWRRSPGEDRAVGAFALLAEVERRTASDASALVATASLDAWARPEHRIALPSPTLDPRAERIEALIGQGRRALREAVDETTLEGFYHRLLIGQRPASLEAQRPLPALALAALLWPLPDALADVVSLAGWIPSSRIAARSLVGVWDGVVGQVPAETRTVASPDMHYEAATEAAACVRRLVETDSPAPALPEEPAWVATVERFVADPDQRWLPPEAVATLTPIDEPALVDRLVDHRVEVERTRPPGADVWQWQVKVDLLTALLVAMAPERAIDDALRCTSGLVPPLLYVTCFDESTRDAWSGRAGEAAAGWGLWGREVEPVSRLGDRSRELSC